MIAALGMYDWPEVRDRADNFWSRTASALNEAGIAAPESLERSVPMQETWRDPALLLGQTCGLPYVSGRCGDALIVARGDYGLPGADDGTYSSAIVCRIGHAGSLADFRGAHAVINEYGSQSGCNALADACIDAGIASDGPVFRKVSLSGAHRASGMMVANGQADIAAIDAVSWALFAEVAPGPYARLQVLDWTRRMPSLPFITSSENRALVPKLRNALHTAVGASPGRPGPGVPVGITAAENADYDAIRKMAQRVRGVVLAPDAEPLGGNA